MFGINKLIEHEKAKFREIRRKQNYEKAFQTSVKAKVEQKYYQAKEKEMIKQAEIKARTEINKPKGFEAFKANLQSFQQKTNKSRKKLKSKNKKLYSPKPLTETNRGAVGLQFGGHDIDTGGSGSPFNQELKGSPFNK